MATQVTPSAAVRRESLEGLASQGLTPSGEVHWNFVAPELVEAAMRRGEGRLAEMGPFVAVTSPHTGRSPNDKFVVQESSSEADVDWGKVNQPMTQAHYEALKEDVKHYLNTRSELFVHDLYCGADPSTRLSVRYVLPNAWHASFVRNMFIRPAVEHLATFAPNFTVYHAPEYQADPAKHGTRTGTFIVLNIAERTILIGGTRYAGELKKAMFTVMNYLLPKQGVLSMHCSANIGPAGDTALFFGLSGTGKTTLSADPTRGLIGDDEHGWSPEGTFNFEGGCYAKVINLSPENEPDIYQTTQMFGTVLENVVLNEPSRSVDFANQSITENTRASYPLHYIKNHVPSGRGGHPKNVVFLTADAFGVLPPIAKLTPEQAMYYFLSGSTAKVAGTTTVTGPASISGKRCRSRCMTWMSSRCVFRPTPRNFSKRPNLNWSNSATVCTPRRSSTFIKRVFSPNRAVWVAGVACCRISSLCTSSLPSSCAVCTVGSSMVSKIALHARCISRVLSKRWR